MTERERKDKKFVEFIKNADEEELRVMSLAVHAIAAGGEESERIKRGSDWMNRPGAEKLSHSDALKAIEAIATGNLDGLPDYLKDDLQEVLFK